MMPFEPVKKRRLHYPHSGTCVSRRIPCRTFLYVAIMENRTGRIDRKDVFLAGLVEHARFEGPWEMPVIPASDCLPDKLLAFDHALSKDRFDHFVHFYIDDERFERIWKRPADYLSRLSKFWGVISPDFSLYRDLPLGMQLWNTYRGRAIGHWLARNGVHVIPNVRLG